MYSLDALKELFNCKTNSNTIHNSLDIEWYLKGVFKNFEDFNIKTQNFVIQTPEYFLQLCALFAESNKVTVANYIGFYALQD